MGFVVLFKFALKCFDILAWPLFAFVYPLWASIQAIEDDDSSLSECRKLVAYWVLFSIIFLFEQAFEKLLQCLPFWLYIKLIITCWLVTSNFGGAFYVYKHLVCPCLSVDINALINKFKAWADFSPKSSNSEDEVKRYVKENGPQLLEEFAASEVKCKEADVVQKDVKTVQVKEQIKDVAASEPKKIVPDFVKEVSLTGPDHITQTENKKPDHTDIKSSEKVQAVGKFLEIPVPEQVQKEWTCAVCQVTTPSETILKSHLRGRKHNAACEELKAKTQQSKNKDSKAPEIKEQENSTDGAKRRRRRKKNEQGPEEKLKNPPVEFRGNLWFCDICNIFFMHKGNMDIHLNDKHLDRLNLNKPVAPHA